MDNERKYCKTTRRKVAKKTHQTLDKTVAIDTNSSKQQVKSQETSGKQHETTTKIVENSRKTTGNCS